MSQIYEYSAQRSFGHSPLVTTVVPAYNHGRYVQETIRSLIAQTYPNIELFVFNDGSTDDTDQKVGELIEECRRRFVRFEYTRHSNRGISAIFNEGLRLSRGEFFTVIASDDIALPHKTETLVAALQSAEPECAAVFGNATFIDSEGRPLLLPVLGSSPWNEQMTSGFVERHALGRSISTDPANFGSYASLLAANYLPAMAALVRTDLIRSVGGWTSGNIVEDWEMWLKLARRHKLRYIGEPVALYRIHGTNTHVQSGRTMSYWVLRILMNEKSTCRERGLISTWRDLYLARLMYVLSFDDLGLTKKVRLLDPVEIFGIARRIGPKILKKMRR